eukprot:GHVR01059528.1.p1 GENE.GHVR01059528.1~~GHVR01059528.1.p1  ORF type:complete len:213 (+),score=47.58 GHVR01059528.1:67-705(+)
MDNRNPFVWQEDYLAEASTARASVTAAASVAAAFKRPSGKVSGYNPFDDAEMIESGSLPLLSTYGAPTTARGGATSAPTTRDFEEPTHMHTQMHTILFDNEAVQEEITRERLRSMKEIHTKVNDIKCLHQDLSLHVAQQSHITDNIESNVLRARERHSEGTQHLIVSRRLQRRHQRKLLFMLILVVIIILCGVIYVASAFHTNYPVGPSGKH